MAVEPDGPAGRAGLRAGDLLVAVNGQPITRVADLHRVLAEGPIGHPLTLTVLRGTEAFDVAVAPAEAP